MMAATSGIFFLTCIALTVANSTVDESCPASAVKLVGNEKFFRIKNQRCFLFVDYDKVEFKDARKKCKSNGGSLAMPKTKEVNDFLIQEMKKYFGNSPLWIGMHDTVEEGKMVWEDGTVVEDWGNFDQGNGGLFGGGEDCVALDPTNEKWHDYGCFQTGVFAQNNKLGFICEYSKMKDGGDNTQVGGGTTGQGDQAGDDSGQGDQAGDDSGQGDQARDDSGQGDQAGDDSGQGDQAGDDSRQGDQAGDDSGQGDQAGDDSGQGDQAGEDSGQGDQGGDAGTGQGDQAGDDSGQGDQAGDDSGQGDQGGDADTGQGDQAGDDSGQGDQAGDDSGQGDQAGDDSGQGDQAGDDSGQGDQAVDAGTGQGDQAGDAGTGQGVQAGGVGDGAKLVEKDKCPTFDCGDLDCGMDGYKIEDGCQFCECNE